MTVAVAMAEEFDYLLLNLLVHFPKTRPLVVLWLADSANLRPYLVSTAGELQSVGAFSEVCPSYGATPPAIAKPAGASFTKVGSLVDNAMQDNGASCTDDQSLLSVDLHTDAQLATHINSCDSLPVGRPEAATVVAERVDPVAEMSTVAAIALSLVSSCTLLTRKNV